MVPRLVCAGHTVEQAEDIARQVPAYREADPQHLGVFARAIAAFWQHLAEQSPMPHRANLAKAATVWAG